MVVPNIYHFPLGENVAALDPLSQGSDDVPLPPPESEELVLDMCSPCSPCSPCSVASSIVVHISEEERRKYEEEICKLYKQLDDKVIKMLQEAIYMYESRTDLKQQMSFLMVRTQNYKMWIAHVLFMLMNIGSGTRCANEQFLRIDATGENRHIVSHYSVLKHVLFT